MGLESLARLASRIPTSVTCGPLHSFADTPLALLKTLKECKRCRPMKRLCITQPFTRAACRLFLLGVHKRWLDIDWSGAFSL